MNQDSMVFFQEIKDLPTKIKDGAYVINLDEYKNIKANIFRVQANDSVMYGYFCIGLIDLMLAGKKLTDYTNLFSPHDLKKNNDVILSYFKNE